MKKCNQCGTEKEESEFYVQNKTTGYRYTKCKTCICEAVRKYRLENIEKVRQYDMKRASLPHRIASNKAHSCEWRSKDGRRMKCHNAVARAILSGDIVKRPCSVCGTTRAFAHHEDYDKPLDVVWYCQAHHKARHKEIDMASQPERIAA